MMQPEEISRAHRRIAPHIVRTPILMSETLNAILGGTVYFKWEGFQKTGSFKFRGALNTLLALQEQGALPAHIVAYSSGNHAQAVAYAAKLFGVNATIFIPEFSSQFKIDATRAQGAAVVLTKTRDEAESACQKLTREGATLVPPFDHDMIIAGQGTSCYEALSDGVAPDAIFATVGGGGWISGTYLASRLLCPTAQVIGGEPALGNDATLSYRSGKIHRLSSSPATIADGARTPAVAERTFRYIQKLDGMLPIDEADIIHWTQLLTQQLKVTVEPTSAVAAAACAQWLGEPENVGKRVLVMLSGGNIDGPTQQKIWQ